MKKLLSIMAVLVALTLTARAAEGYAKPNEGENKKRPALTPEQKTQRKELIEKYDTNKNKRLDKEERSKMTPEDAQKWESLTPPPRAKSAEKTK
jgi:GH35 family endo-1,4-beta-xylanase